MRGLLERDQEAVVDSCLCAGTFQLVFGKEHIERDRLFIGECIGEAWWCSTQPLTMCTQLQNLKQLAWLWISDTRIVDEVSGEIVNVGITGSLPTWIGLLTKLEGLQLHNNALTGTIPTELGDLTNLNDSLDLYGNELTGTIPTELGSLESLTELYLSFNQLAGALPTQLGTLAALTYLWISDTGDAGIAGTIPTEFGDLSNLESLQLQNNALTGTIPGALAALDIVDFDVCGNQLDSYPEECPSSSPSSMPPVDTDNDGVPDYLDQCPDEGGYIHADGCPVDSDNDGVRVRRIAGF